MCIKYLPRILIKSEGLFLWITLVFCRWLVLELWGEGFLSYVRHENVRAVAGAHVLLLFLLVNLGESSMKTFGRLFGACVALLASALAFAASPPEQVPRQQFVQHQTGVVVAGDVIVAPIGQDQAMTLVKQRHNPPVMIKMVLPAAENVQRTLWIEVFMSSGITKMVTASALPTADGSHGLRMPSTIAFNT